MGRIEGGEEVTLYNHAPLAGERARKLLPWLCSIVVGACVRACILPALATSVTRGHRQANAEGQKHTHATSVPPLAKTPLAAPEGAALRRFLNPSSQSLPMDQDLLLIFIFNPRSSLCLSSVFVSSIEGQAERAPALINSAGPSTAHLMSRRSAIHAPRLPLLHIAHNLTSQRATPARRANDHVLSCARLPDLHYPIDSQLTHNSTLTSTT